MTGPCKKGAAALAFFLIARMNLKAAGKLQERIEELDARMGRQP
jgi:hypothetical protein